MNPTFAFKIRLLGEFSIFGILAGIIFQLLHEQRLDHSAFLVGVSLGAVFGFIELFIFSGLRKKFLQLPLLLAIFVKALVYLFVINFVTGILALVTGLLQGMQLEDFFRIMFGKIQLILNIYALLLFIIFSFYIQVNFLLGERVLWKFLLGKYRKPTSEHRIFMFLDLKSSTTIAEKLGLVRYYSLLNDFFHEISEPVRSTNAEIYQYVGDEVVFSWRTKEGLKKSNCLKIFYKIQEKVYSNRKYYREKYGDIPKFKAGVHVGEVISAQIGDIKREIVYNGDVLNTSARIQEQCKVYNRDLIVSGSLLKQLNLENEFLAEKIDTVKLRGKESSLELFSLIRI